MRDGESELHDTMPRPGGAEPLNAFEKMNSPEVETTEKPPEKPVVTTVVLPEVTSEKRTPPVGNETPVKHARFVVPLAARPKPIDPDA